MNTRLKQLLILLLVTFFVVLMISFSFPDLLGVFYVPHWFGHKNIYTVVKANKSICLWLDATYPPLYYVTMGTYMNLLQGVGIFPSDFFTQTPCPVFEVINNQTFLFWAKLPFLLLHFASAVLFSKFFEKKRFLWFLFWLTAPILIFVNFIEAQFEIIPVFFILLSLYAVKKEHPVKAALFLGLGGAYKHFPFLLFPVLLISQARSWREATKMIIVAGLPYLLGVLPLFGTDFIASMLNFNENQKMLAAGFTIGGLRLSYYLVLYLVVMGILLFQKRNDFFVTLKSYFLVSVIYFITTPLWFVQRILFLIPSLMLLVGYMPKSKRKLALLSVLFFVYTLVLFPGLFDHTLLRPISAYVLNSNFFQRLDPFTFASLQKGIVLIFNLMFLTLIYLVVRTKSPKEQQITIPELVTSFTPILLYLLANWFFWVESGSHL